MHLTVNGEPQDVPEAVSITDLLVRFGITAARVAVEVNDDVVPRETYGARRLADGDRVEIVHFVGGG